MQPVCSWPYASTYEFPAPTGDVYFAQTFQDVLTKSPLVSAYNNASTWNPQVRAALHPVVAVLDVVARLLTISRITSRAVSLAEQLHQLVPKL
ncbi:MAG: hypothetical protein EOO65_00565 [Methanosarcinales archaeon]|nr:MAG: hypothetical protein EOO65_00565 [Methanosarcinales archaeon]